MTGGVGAGYEHGGCSGLEQGTSTGDALNWEHPAAGPRPGCGGCVGAGRSRGVCPALLLLPTSAVSRRLEQLRLHTGRCH